MITPKILLNLLYLKTNHPAPHNFATPCIPQISHSAHCTSQFSNSPPCTLHVDTGSSGKDKKRKEKCPSTLKRDKARLVNLKLKKKGSESLRGPSPSIQHGNESAPRPSSEHGNALDVEKLTEPKTEPQDIPCLLGAGVGLDLEHFVEPIVRTE